MLAGKVQGGCRRRLGCLLVLRSPGRGRHHISSSHMPPAVVVQVTLVPAMSPPMPAQGDHPESEWGQAAWCGGS